MELKRYRDAESFQFGNLVVRDMTPALFDVATFSHLERSKWDARYGIFSASFVCT